MSTRTGATEPKKKDVTYKDLRALKIAKGAKKLPRGVKADFSLDDNELTFRVPGQDVPVLTVTLRNYIESSLKADGFKLAD